MASGTVPSPGREQQSVRLAVGQYDTLIDQRLRVTRRHVKSVDVTVGLMQLAIGSLAFLMAVALADHWLAKGGLGVGLRAALLAAWLAAGGLYFLVRVLPPLWHRVNPVFAARTIEQTAPTLKNSLINFLLLRTAREHVAPAIYQALEHRAAADLTQVPVDTVVDRSRIVRLGYVLAGFVAVVCLYMVFSPKNPLVSFERLLWPWADLPVPSRVKIDRVEPGDLASFQGEFVTVSAEVSGLKAGEQVLLYFGTADGEVVDQTIPMTVPEGGYRQRGVLPPGSRGLQQDLWYYLAAGDARSRRFKIQAQINPIITVDRVDYHYPPYTGIPDRSVEREGDIRAIEGTEITIHASANQEIARAEIDLDCKAVGGLPMRVKGAAASGQFTLRMKADEPASPEHNAYQLHFVDRHGGENRKPIRYRIEVVPDAPPDVRILAPQEENIQLPENGQLEFRVWASDPDFGLRRVALRAEKEKRGLAIPLLLNKLPPLSPHKGDFVGSYLFQPERLELKAGDQVTYWAEAEDNRGDDETPPAPNHSETVKRWITIVAADRTAAGQHPTPADHAGQPNQDGNEQNPQQPHDKSDGNGQSPGQKSPQDPSKDQQPQKEHQGPSGKGEAQKDPQGEKSDSKEQQNGGSPDKKDQPQQGAGASKSDNQSGGESQGANGKDSQQSQSKEQNGPNDQSAGGKSADKSQATNEPVDPETDPGTAFEKILDRAQTGKQDQGKKDQQKLASNNPQQQSQPGQPNEAQGKQPQPGQPNEAQGKQPQPGQQNESQGKQPQPGQQNEGQGKQSQPGQQSEGQGKQSQPGQQSEGQGKQSQPGQQSEGQGKQQQPGQQSEGQGKQQQPGQQGQTHPGDNRSGTAADKASMAADGNDKQSDQHQPSGDKPASADKGQAGSEKQAGQKSRQAGKSSDSSQQKTGSQQGTPENAQSKGGDKNQLAQRPENTPGAQAMSAPEKEKEQQSPGENAQQKTGQQKEGRPDDSNGKAGSGNGSDQTQGSPKPQASNSQGDKKASPSGDSGQHGQGSKPSPAANDAKSSQSQSADSGDRRGQGKAGQGQQSKAQGSGNAGSHTPAKEGAAQSDPKGDGDVGPKNGDQVKSDTGKGAGPKTAGQSKDSQTAEKKSENGSGNNSSQTAQGGQSQSTASTKSGNAGENAGKEPSGESGGTVPTGVGQSTAAPEGTSSPAPETQRDDPNQEFANKQTDLALEYLRDQLAKEKPDPDLLKQLNWSKETLQAFYDRWAQMKRAAEQEPAGSNAARQRYLDALKSLGLSSHAESVRGGTTQRDQVRQMRVQRHVDAPAGWRDIFKAYTEGISGGGEQK